ncbi:response regulator [Parasaccharibacter sp. TMW2.1882]|uniref:Chemotaxis regulator-transmits chemoreceptor signals to flagelllar motor components CheY n=2 Tax=Acetobacteraceae TaxID=433 RepID=A0A7U7J019_9PROT|nr:MULTISPECIES: response regulator [Acetobacteraceae]MCL1562401.1 response regulator [Parasaccharibacter sp. TMW 2.1886]MCQ0040882.1 response regulator [Bombella sp.]MUG79902.1 response regulator [Bombella sp. ESL0380]MUH03255.1 response regulator [Bombella sp. ESL0387]QGT75502.1 response regulator [Bombella sp. ESL0368]
MTDEPKVRVLTVDDSRTMQGVLRKALSEAGYDVIQGGDGVEGLEVLQQADPMPQAIITDINMPRMDGFQFIEAVRKLEAFSSIPIICLTTETDEEKKNRARSLGATGWIAKPFNAEKLVWAIRRVTA